MSTGEVTRLSTEHLQLVQNLIENCIQLHMSKEDTVDVLSREATIQKGVTEVVWQRLEQENQDFFEFYHIRLALKEQIKVFNELLKKQADLMGQIQSPPLAASMTESNGSRMAQFQQNAVCYNQAGPSSRPDTLGSTVLPSVPFANGVSTLQSSSTFNLPTQMRRANFLPEEVHVHSSNSLRLMQGLNGGPIKAESVYPSGSQLVFPADGSVVDTHATIEDQSIANYSHVEASSRPTNGLLDIDNSSFGQLGIPKNFSFTELYHLGGFSSLGYGSTSGDNFLDPRNRGENTDENRTLEGMSESYSIEDLAGSE